jgi:mannosyl-glycoprotein endo-beta-N-acetylglucosaminidase
VFRRNWAMSALVAVAGAVTAVAFAAAPANAATTGIAATVRTSGGSVNIRNGGGTTYDVIRTVPNGAVLHVTCRVTGTWVRSSLRNTNFWDRVTTGGYVSHALVSAAAWLPPCAPRKPSIVVNSIAGPTPGMTNTQFIAASVAPAQQGFREFKVPASVTIAQAILESGWGRSGLSATDRNFFGIKCFSGEHGPIATGCHSYATYECLPTCLPTTATFRVYATSGDSYRDHGRFLVTNSRYKPAFQYSNDPNTFLYQMWKAGYATSPTYVQHVQALMQQYNLYQYDLAS